MGNKEAMRTTANKQTVEAFMSAYRRSDRDGVLACLTDDVEWSVPGAFEAKGHAEFGDQIVSGHFLPCPEITIARLIEADDVVVAEGTVRTQQTDGAVIKLAYCDVFELRDAKIRRLVSYLVNVT